MQAQELTERMKGQPYRRLIDGSAIATDMGEPKDNGAEVEITGAGSGSIVPTIPDGASRCPVGLGVWPRDFMYSSVAREAVRKIETRLCKVGNQG